MGVPLSALIFLLGLAVGLIASPRRAVRLHTVVPRRLAGMWPASARERVRAGTILGPSAAPQAPTFQPATEVAEYERAAARPLSPTSRFRPFWLLHFGGWRPFRGRDREDLRVQRPDRRRPVRQPAGRCGQVDRRAGTTAKQDSGIHRPGADPRDGHRRPPPPATGRRRPRRPNRCVGKGNDLPAPLPVSLAEARRLSQ
jgi:hypothetical protein